MRGALRQWLSPLLLLGALAAALAPAVVQAQGLQPLPALEARVTDLTGTLTAEQQATLESKLAQFEARKGAQLALLIVGSTQPEEIEQYSIRVVEAWKLGRAAPDDGALLLIAKDDRRMRIEVGRGLEGALTDLVSKRIVSDVIAPLFRQGDFYGGVNAGLDQMIRVVDGEQLPPPDERWSRGFGSGLVDILPFLLVAVFIGSMVLRAIFGRGLGSLLTGAGTGGLVWVLTHLIPGALLAGVAAMLFSLVLSSMGGGRWSSSPRHGGWGGGWGGGMGGGGFGGGGFGGGGGSFGGGGASGSW